MEQISLIEGIILQSRDYKENSKLFTLFSPERGEITLLAKGIKSKNGRLKGKMQPFIHLKITYLEGYSLGLITQVEVLTPFTSIPSDLDRLEKGYECLWTLKNVIQKDLSNPTLFNIAIATLSELDKAPLNALGDRIDEFKMALLLSEGVYQEKSDESISQRLSNYIGAKYAPHFS